MINRVALRTQMTAVLVTTGLFLASLIGSANAAENPEGTWRMTNGKVTVRVDFCGGSNICATIVGMGKPLDKHGNPKRDKDNPNPSLRSRPVIGLQVVNGMSPDGDGVWSGKIYNADDGGTYRGKAYVNGNSLVIKACILGGLACKKQTFSRTN